MSKRQFFSAVLVCVAALAPLVAESAPKILESRSLLTYADVKPVFDKRCAVCHKGPWLDLRTFPFVYEGMTSQFEMVAEFVRRMRLPPEDWDRMPTRNAKPMTEDEIRLVERWLADGVNAD